MRDQRNSWHGVDYPYNHWLDIAEYFERYAETLRGIDDSIGRVLAYREADGLLTRRVMVGSSRVLSRTPTNSSGATRRV